MKYIVKKGYVVDGRKEGQTVVIASQEAATRLINAKMIAPVKKN